jgi:subtilisin family serine protease
LGWFKNFTDEVYPLFGWEDEDVRKVKVAILDTGIDSYHPFLTDALDMVKHSRYRDFTKSSLDDVATPTDICGHGTYIAGIFLRLAPHVELYIARVCETTDLGSKEASQVAEVSRNLVLSMTSAYPNIYQAIKHATNDWKVDIISMSFGFEGEHDDITKAIEKAYEKDIVMLAAVSNDGNRPLQPIAFPARNPFVLCINSADGNGNKSSSNSPAPNGGGKTRRTDNFSILGQGFRSCWPNELSKDEEFSEEIGSWKISSGSSVATAVAASVAALVMELGRKNKGLISKHQKLETYRGSNKFSR